MNNKIIIGVVLLILVIGTLVLLTNNKTKINTSVTQTKPGVTQTSNTITIESFSFKPSTLTVKAGATVTWTNQDSVMHNLKSDSFTSPDLNQGEKFEFTFNTKGTFNYTCGVHPSMTGKVIVE